MSGRIALLLAAAAPLVAVPEPHRGGGVTVSVQVSAEILRAETASPEPGEKGTRRQVRRRADGQAAIEFE